MGRCQVLEKLHLLVKMDHEGLIFIFTHHLVKKSVTCAAFLVEDAHLTQTGVHQQAQSQRQTGVVCEIANSLRSSVFFEDEIIFGQIVNDLSVLVTNSRHHIDHLHMD